MNKIILNNLNVYGVSSFSDNGIVSADDSSISKWTAYTYASSQTVFSSSSNRFVLVLSNGNVAFCDLSNNVNLYDVTSSTLSSLSGHGNRIRNLIQLKNSNLLSSSDDGKMKIWDISTKAVKVTCDGSANGAAYASAELTSGYIVSGYSTGTLLIWNPSNGNKIMTVFSNTESIWDIVVLNNGNVATALQNANILIWNSTTWSVVYTLTGHTSVTRTLKVLSNGYLLSGAGQGKIWDPTTGVCKQNLTEPTSDILGTSVLANGNFVLGCYYNKIYVYTYQ